MRVDSSVDDLHQDEEGEKKEAGQIDNLSARQRDQREKSEINRSELNQDQSTCHQVGNRFNLLPTIDTGSSQYSFLPPSCIGGTLVGDWWRFS